MNPNYCNCNDFEKAVDYKDIRYYRPEDDRFNAVKKAGLVCSLPRPNDACLQDILT
jgi:hypothetical protein